MVSGTLYTYPGSFRANKILITAAYSGSELTVPEFEFGRSNKTPEFLKKFPFGKVPAFESNGTFLNETDSIAHFVANNALQGGDDAGARAVVMEYNSFTELEIIPSACTWVFPTLGLTSYNKQETEKAISHIKKCMTILDNHFFGHTFAVGERITLADITLCTALVMCYVQVFDANFRAQYPNVTRWFMTCINQPNFKKVLGGLKLCEKVATFDKTRFQELQKKYNDDKPKKEKKTEKPKEEKKPAEAAPKPAKVDYFADVPKSETFDMNTWKETYGKQETAVSQKWFADNFDPAAFSVWHGEFKYPEEHEKDTFVLTFMEGYKGRCDSIRKFAHAMMLSNPVKKGDTTIHYQLTCLWIVRGPTFIFERNEDWDRDTELFNWTKIEDKEEMCKAVNGYFYSVKNLKGEECEDYASFI